MATLSRQTCSAYSTRLHCEGPCVPRAISAQALRNPDAVALIAGTQVLNYRDLDCHSNRLAHHLRSLGVGTDVLVGLCLPRSLDRVVAALGIWKTGGAYVPLGPTCPPQQLAFMLQHAQVPVLVTGEAFVQRPPDIGAEVVDVNAPEISECSEYLPRIAILRSDLAYVAYTSGSTETPKGLEITHAELANFVSSHRHAFCVTAADRVGHVAGLDSDAAMCELWPNLVAGASVYLTDEITRCSPELLRDWLVAKGITISFVPTPMAERMHFLDWPPETALRIVQTGGDTPHYSPSPGLPFALVDHYRTTDYTAAATPEL